MVNEPTKLNTPVSPPIRRLLTLLGLLVVNFLVYVAVLIPLSLKAPPDISNPLKLQVPTPIFTIPIIAGYYILEGSLFFGCRAFIWPFTLTFRIIWMLHDFTYFFTYAVEASWNKGAYLNYAKPWDEKRWNEQRE